MSTRRLLLVTPYLTTFPRSETEARVRYRWRAELLRAEDRHPLFMVEGYTDPDSAIGSLIQEAVLSFDTHDDIITFLAGLFGDLSFRPASVTLARAIRFANSKPQRRHPGIDVRIDQPVGADQLPARAALKVKKGGGA